MRPGGPICKFELSSCLPEELLGSWPALALQALLFGFSHLANENATISGSAYSGLLVQRVTGPAWLTGGVFGIEASYIAILICCVAGVALRPVGAAHREESDGVRAVMGGKK